MSSDSSNKYYQNNKERLQKIARERYESLSKEENEKKRRYKTVVNDPKIYQKIKKKGLLSTEENIIK